MYDLMALAIALCAAAIGGYLVGREHGRGDGWADARELLANDDREHDYPEMV
jgi:hypothetical protein